MNEILEPKTSTSKFSIKNKPQEGQLLIPTKVNILWTGGFDSTLRMLQLSKLEVDIQPYYLSDKRISEKYELAAIAAITENIENHPETRCRIAPLKIIKVSDVETDELLTSAYKRLNEVTPIGIQYEWIGRFAQTIPGLELCLEKSHAGKAYKCILTHGKVVKVNEGKVSYCIVNKKESSTDVIKVFGNYHFPIPIFDKTKQQMLEDYKELGFENTVEKTWFCHEPIKHEPCGICNPCKSVIEEGLEFRLSPKGFKRYRHYLKFGDRRWFSLYLKINRIITNSL